MDLPAEEFRRIGHQLIDDLAHHLNGIRDLPVATDDNLEQVRALLGQESLSEGGADPGTVLKRALELIAGHNRLTGHPRQWGYIIGSAAPAGALAELIAATINPNVVSWKSSPMASEIERQVIGWIADLLGYPADGGLMVSGGNAANFVGFCAARRAKADWDIRRRGVAGAPDRPLCLYVSRETHTWVEKAADLSGLGTDAIRWIDTDARQRMRAEALHDQIRADRNAGFAPFLVVGNAGTVSTGAVDPLAQLAAIAREEDLWFHVDGAYGAPAVIAGGTPPELAGIREADSLAVDAHKWLYMSLEGGCALIRDRTHLTDAFAFHPDYYQGQHTEQPDLVNFHEMGPQNSRGFRALKAWVVLQQAGVVGLRAQIEHDIELAKELYRVMLEADDFEVFTCELSITTFRFVPSRINAPEREAYLDRLNRALMSRVQGSGKAYLSNAVIDGRFVLRTCITNFRTRIDDVLALPALLRAIGEPLHREISGGADTPS